MDEFWRRVVKEEGNGCWMWQGKPGTHGYGTFRQVLAHRKAFELQYGPVPPGMFVCHRCDVKLCVRPEHLFMGSHNDNMADHSRKGRHPLRRLTEAQVLELRALRAQGMTQRECAKRAGITQRAVWNIENGLSYKFVG